MSLLRFTSDKGRGYQYSQVWIESSQVVAIQPIHESRMDNLTVITLANGLTESVREDPKTVAQMVKSPTGPDACAEDAR